MTLQKCRCRQMFIDRIAEDRKTVFRTVHFHFTDICSFRMFRNPGSSAFVRQNFRMDFTQGTSESWRNESDNMLRKGYAVNKEQLQTVFPHES